MARKKLHDLPDAERRIAHRILDTGGPVTRGGRVVDGKFVQVYHEGVPQKLIDFFLSRLEKLEDVERIVTDKGDTKYIQKPTELPTLAAFALEMGVGPSKLNDWAARYEEFAEAMDVARAAQEHLLVNQSLRGGYNPNAAALVLKNYHGWADKVEQHLKAAVILRVDGQDTEA